MTETEQSVKYSTTNATRTNISWGGEIKTTGNHEISNNRIRTITGQGGRERDKTRCQIQQHEREDNFYKLGWRTKANSKPLEFQEQNKNLYRSGWKIER